MTDKPALSQIQLTVYHEGWLIGITGTPVLPPKQHHSFELNRLYHKGWSDGKAGLDRQYTAAKE